MRYLIIPLIVVAVVLIAGSVVRRKISSEPDEVVEAVSNQEEPAIDMVNFMPVSSYALAGMALSCMMFFIVFLMS